MISCRTFTNLIVLTGLLSTLYGCAPAGTDTNTDMAKPPAPIISKAEQVSKNQIPPARPHEQEVSSPEQVPARQPVFAPREPEQPGVIPVSASDIEFVQQRLNEYRNKLNQWLEISNTNEESKIAEELSSQGIECVQLLERLLTGYDLLLERMQQSETVHVDRIATVDPKKMQQLDIAFLESRCVEILTMDTKAQQEYTTDEEAQYTFEEAQKIITSQVSSENYQDAILWYSKLSQDYPGQKPSVITELNYGLALQYSGQVEAAAEHFNKMLTSGNLSVEPLRLQLEIADLHLAGGNIAAAESYYENSIRAHKSVEAGKIWAAEQLEFLRSVDPQSEDILSYIKLLHDFQIYDYRIHSVALNRKVDAFIVEHAGSPLEASASRLKAYTIEKMNSWFGRQLLLVDSLVADKRFTEASDILKNMTRYYLPADLQAIVQKTYYEVGQAELQETENQRLQKEKALAEQWDSAVHLMDSQRFYDAISAFESLKGTELEDKARLKIIETANLAAAQMRKEAASLFMRASKTPDIEKKKELLLDSHRMLNEVLVKFPQTDLLDKVQQNLEILEEQISKIDPALLEILQEEYSSAIPEETQEAPAPISTQD